MLNIVWFKRDLRITDHEPLVRACAAGPVLPLYIVEPGLWAQPDASARQWAFAAECLGALQHDLAVRGQRLAIMVGEAVAIFRALHQAHGISAIWSHMETGNGWTYDRDRAVGAWAREAGVAWHEFQQFGVIRRLRSRDGWARRWDQMMAKPLIPAPSDIQPLPASGGPSLPTDIPTAQTIGLRADPCPGRQPGGRSAGLAVLDQFLAVRGRDYRWRMSSPVTAFEASSRLSPYLSWGALSMREVAQATAARLRNLPMTDPDAQRWRASLISFAGRQHWHCHFMQKLEDEPRLEFENLHRAYDGLRPAQADQAALAAWCAGTTGFPFIDACMRALDHFGWLNFRMRAMLTSFASYHLWLPWRMSGLHLARQFVDYEPGIHWPQIQMQSGTTGINTMRVYNPVKQGLDHDPTGQFVRRFVPELRGVPDAYIHQPWLWPAAASLGYPPPIIDHEAAARAARAALHAVRVGSDHQAQAAKIADRHGSRKAGIPMTGRKRGGPAKPGKRGSPVRPGKQGDSNQLSFDL